MNNNKKGSKPIECPFCGCRTILATVLTTFSFVSEHTVYTDGVNVLSGDTLGGMIGEPNGEPIIKPTHYRCTSCKKKWISSFCKLVKDENGVCSFVKVEQKPRKGKRKQLDTKNNAESEGT